MRNLIVLLAALFLATLRSPAEVEKSNTINNNLSGFSELISASEIFMKQGDFDAARQKAEQAKALAGNRAESAAAQLALLKTLVQKPNLKKNERQEIDNLYLAAMANADDNKPLQLKIIEVVSGFYERSNLKEKLAAVLKTKVVITTALQQEKTESEMQERIRIQQQLISLMDTNNVLGSQIAMQRSKINNMSVAQAKAALEGALQKQMLDSLAMLALMDSMRLQEQSIILSNQADSLQNQQTALSLQKSQRNVFMILAAFVLLVAVVLVVGLLQMRSHNQLLNQKNELIQKEKKNNEELLLNILPKAISDELKEFGAVRAKRYESVSVLFSDFVNFSQISETLSPEDLVRELDYCFKQFDKIVVKNGLEKIKTIGDAYMCAGGLPEDNDLHAEHAVKTALEMQQFLQEWNAERKKNHLPEFHARIGINTGALVAGVVGIKKFAYDIWGDTVNVASRMESSCEPDKINISGNTYLQVRDKFNCVYRGKLPIKNKGEVDMYFVSGSAA
ncbi:MAG: adenylate/guanylate cyclase domain-containing protein [Bacteroidetes bacterium]|nr:adenylate/guanylate cyclase domain-containing protein [Bacteroidota bacterium]MBK8659734.1 adenylate/guanylate cyclase domain-containing protein [Bacteroidota bacterium]